MSTAAATRSSVVGHRRVQGGRWWPEPQPEAHVPTPGTQGPPLAWGRQAPSRGDTVRHALPCVPGCAGWRLSDHTGRETPRSLGAEAYGRRAPFPPRVLEPVSHLASSQGRRAAGPGASSHAAMGTGGAARRPARPSVRGACTGRCSTATSAETDSWRLKAFVSADRLARWWGPPLFHEGSPTFHVVPGTLCGPPCCARCTSSEGGPSAESVLTEGRPGLAATPPCPGGNSGSPPAASSTRRVSFPWSSLRQPPCDGRVRSWH